MKRLLAALFVLASITSALAWFPHGKVSAVVPFVPVAINNFDNAVTFNPEDIVSHYDVNGDKIDAHDGGIIKVGSTFYLYGTAYSCGFMWQAATPFCGFKVYTSDDLVHWTPQGFVFDATTTAWQNMCKGRASALGGCFNMHMIWNPSTNKYVAWFAEPFGGVPQSTSGFKVLVCDTPLGPCTLQADPTGLSHNGNGDGGPFVDSGGNPYIAYSNIGPPQHIYVQALNAAYTDASGSAVDTGAIGEAVWGLEKGGVYYVIYGQTGCGYCNNAAVLYVSAASALGTYAAPVTINANGCYGQSRGVSTIVAGGLTTYLYMVDQWFYGSTNEGAGDTYFQPLTFTGSAINAFACAQTADVPGLSLDAATPPFPVPDQTSVRGPSLDTFNEYPTIGTSIFYLQTFVPTVSTLSKVVLPLGQGCLYNAPGCTPAGIDGNAVVKIVTLDGGNNPVSTLGSVSFTSAQLAFAQKAMTATFNLSGLTPGAHYGIEISGTNTVNGISIARQVRGTSAYPAGILRNSNDGGATWVADAIALMFSTYP